VLQSDLGYVPIAWGALYAAVKPWVRGLQGNRAGDLVVDGNIYADTSAVPPRPPPEGLRRRSRRSKRNLEP